MRVELRDLDADRSIVDTLYRIEPHQWTIREKSMLLATAAAALDEIDRLKRLLVWQVGPRHWVGRCDPPDIWPDKETAWREVRLAAMNYVGACRPRGRNTLLMDESA